jgi:hypothetical protein
VFDEFHRGSVLSRLVLPRAVPRRADELNGGRFGSAVDWKRFIGKFAAEDFGKTLQAAANCFA